MLGADTRIIQSSGDAVRGLDLRKGTKGAIQFSCRWVSQYYRIHRFHIDQALSFQVKFRC